MNPNQLQNLKVLINSSSILSGQERSEWLSLLDLMDDKQRGELENILASNKNLPAALKFAPAPLFVPPKAQSGPMHLGHILNIPQGTLTAEIKLEGKSGPPPMPPPRQGNSQPPPVAAKEQLVSFSQKLKNILSEKELPGGHKSQPPELPGPPGPPSGFKAKPQEPKPVMPPVFPKTAPLPPKPKFSLPGSGLAEQFVRIPTKPNSGISGQGLRPFVPGINFPKPALQETIKAGAKPAIKPSTQEAPQPGSVNKPQEQQGQFQNLADVSVLTKDLWEKFGKDSLALACKKLMAGHGYHEVIFSLEKSPLYKNYLETGAAILKQGDSFEQFSKSQNLSRKQFEDFADMLREIQTG